MLCDTKQMASILGMASLLGGWAALTCELQHTVQPAGIGVGGVSQSGGPLQIGCHLIFKLQLREPTPGFEVGEVDLLVWLRLCCCRLQIRNKYFTQPFCTINTSTLNSTPVQMRSQPSTFLHLF